jgi:hypothetical protein
MFNQRAAKATLPKPDLPLLLAKMEHLTDMMRCADELRQEIEHDWIRLNKEDKDRFQVISNQPKTRAPRGASAPPKARRRPSWMVGLDLDL